MVFMIVAAAHSLSANQIDLCGAARISVRAASGRRRRRRSARHNTVRAFSESASIESMRSVQIAFPARTPSPYPRVRFVAGVVAVADADRVSADHKPCQ